MKDNTLYNELVQFVLGQIYPHSLTNKAATALISNWLVKLLDYRKSGSNIDAARI